MKLIGFIIVLFSFYFNAYFLVRECVDGCFFYFVIPSLIFLFSMFLVFYSGRKIVLTFLIISLIISLVSFLIIYYSIISGGGIGYYDFIAMILSFCVQVVFLLLGLLSAQLSKV